MADPIQERIKKLDPEYRDFVLGDFPEETARIFGAPLGLNEDALAAFENGISLHLLFFLSKEELIEFLVSECDLLPGEAVTVVDSIREGLPEGLVHMIDATNASVSAQRPAEGEERNSPEQEQAQFIPTSVASGGRQQSAAPTQVAQREAEAPAEEEGAVQPLRTMEEDMDQIHGYGAYRKMYPDPEGDAGSGEAPRQAEPAQQEEEVVQSTSQEEMLNKRPPLAGTPSYDKPPEQ